MKHVAMIVMATALVLAVAGGGTAPADFLTGVGTAPAAFAAPAYEMVFAAPSLGGSPSVFRIAVATGQVMAIGTQFGPIADAAPLPLGDYHLHVTETPDQKTYWLYRMDSQSGRVWFLSNNTWTEIPAPK